MVVSLTGRFSFGNPACRRSVRTAAYCLPHRFDGRRIPPIFPFVVRHDDHATGGGAPSLDAARESLQVSLFVDGAVDVIGQSTQELLEIVQQAIPVAVVDAAIAVGVVVENAIGVG